MKGPLIAIGVLLAMGCGLVFWRQTRVHELQRQLEELHGEAARKGIVLKMSASTGRKLRGAENRTAGPQVDKLMDLLGRVEQIERAGGRSDEALCNQIVEASVYLMELSPSNLRKVLNRVRDNPALSEDTKAKLIGRSLMFVSSKYPEEVLAMVEESKELFSKGSMMSNVVGSALQSFAESNPKAAMQWLTTNQSKLGNITQEEMQHSVLSGAAKYDPATAFRLLSEMELDGNQDACEVIASALSETQKGREDLLKAMRGYLADTKNERTADKVSSAVMESLGRGVGKNTFAAMSQWLDGESLPQSDLASFTRGLSWFSTGSETGEWLDWMSQRLPADLLAEPVEGLVGDWVEADYLAAGKWLTKLPDGPVKMPAVKAYAEAVAAYDPETATQWAMTIRDQSARQRTLQAIHENWPAGDEAGAAKFAAQHGLE